MGTRSARVHLYHTLSGSTRHTNVPSPLSTGNTKLKHYLTASIGNRDFTVYSISEPKEFEGLFVMTQKNTFKLFGRFIPSVFPLVKFVPGLRYYVSVLEILLLTKRCVCCLFGLVNVSFSG